MAVARKELSRSIKKISAGVLSRAVDLALASVYFGFEASLAGYTKVGFAGEKAIDDLSVFNYSTIKNSLRYLKKRGLVQVTKENFLLPKITQEGRRRLQVVLPSYYSQRTWDGKIYLITYDLPREKNSQRNLLRNYLKKIGCGSLQYSVWLTPFNPKKLIEEFVDKYNLDQELILISSLGKDGTIGEIDLKDLMDNVYKLSKLNERYSEFVENVNRKTISSKDQVVFSFLSILKDDPQIPFKLLPDEWVGDIAYDLYKKIISV